MKLMRKRKKGSYFRNEKWKEIKLDEDWRTSNNTHQTIVLKGNFVLAMVH